MIGRHPELIAAMRADHIPAPQERGLWYIERAMVADALLATFIEHHYHYNQYPAIPHVTTSLNRWTDATLHLGRGECVMSDDPKELKRHLPIVLQARGRVLITGLGLGCVVRGILVRGQVDHVDVIEMDTGVLEMVADTFCDDSRVTIHEGDALTHRWPSDARWDYAWHDIWGDNPGTQVLHAQLLLKYRDLAAQQGAWMFPRVFKRQAADKLRLIDCRPRSVA